MRVARILARVSLTSVPVARTGGRVAEMNVSVARTDERVAGTDASVARTRRAGDGTAYRAEGLQGAEERRRNATKFVIHSRPPCLLLPP